MVETVSEEEPTESWTSSLTTDKDATVLGTSSQSFVPENNSSGEGPSRITTPTKPKDTTSKAST